MTADLVRVVQAIAPEGVVRVRTLTGHPQPPGPRPPRPSHRGTPSISSVSSSRLQVSLPNRIGFVTPGRFSRDSFPVQRVSSWNRAA